MVLRSAITLKMLTSLQYGSTVAAATFGLPATIGAGRNWDYRYTWIRDAAFTMYAFLRLGFVDESKEFIRWLMNRCQQMKDASELQLMYAVDGSSQLQEQVLDHLEGYRGSAPVRIGNAAAQQFQLDIYGELIDTIYLYNKDGGPITYAFWQNVRLFVDYVAANWQRPDHGIWEVRNEQRNFIYSKIMAWVALDRGILIAQSRSFPAPLDEWRRTRDAIYQEVYENYWNSEKEAFVQYKGAEVLDAAVLLMPLVHMFSPAEPRWLSTLKAIEENLVTDSLVYRYKLADGATDGLDGDEGTFSICSFWYIECLARGGQVEKARLYFEKMLGYANHLGLFSEQIGPLGEQLGNFPQAFTHLALISAAFQLNRDLSGPNNQTTPHARWYV
jgi:GH15 family glucan-1,4-alpha-glucosidase